MIKFLQGNLLDAPTEAVVNTVNTVGVMGKGIALMFTETFSENFRAYEAACKRNEIQVGHIVRHREPGVRRPALAHQLPQQEAKSYFFRLLKSSISMCAITPYPLRHTIAPFTTVAIGPPRKVFPWNGEFRLREGD